MENAQAVAKYYEPFGLKYCLVDAGWQAAGNGEKGSPIGGDWNAWNDKFPHGIKWLADQPGSHSGAGGPTLQSTVLPESPIISRRQDESPVRVSKLFHAFGRLKIR